MTSLFSSFDFTLYFLFWSYIMCFICIFFVPLSFYLVNLGYFFSLFYSFILDFIVSLSGVSYGKSFGYFFFLVFIFLFIQNISSIFPFVFPITSHICFIMVFSFCSWVIINYFYVSNNYVSMIVHYVPLGTPIFLVFFMFLIEVVSNFIRPITLIVRLMANILSGHLLIVLLSMLVSFYSIYGILSFSFYIFLTMVELAVSLIQSYIFCVLTCLYFLEIF